MRISLTYGARHTATVGNTRCAENLDKKTLARTSSFLPTDMPTWGKHSRVP